MTRMTRNELYSEKIPLTGINGPINDPSFQGRVADGAMCIHGCTFDTRSGQMIAGNNNDGQTHAYTYDKAGRDSVNTITCSYSTQPGQPPVTGSTTATRTYDFNNHTINETQVNGTNPCGSTVQSLQWGNSAHPYVYSSPNCGGNTPCGSIHWDGDNVLYTVDENNKLTLWIGKLAAVAYGNTYVFDRDDSGAQIEWHWKTCYSPMTPNGARLQVHANGPKISGSGTIFSAYPGCASNGDG